MVHSLPCQSKKQKGEESKIHYVGKQGNLNKYQQLKSAKEAEIASSLEVIESLKEDLSGLQQVLEEKTKVVEQVKKTTSKAAKVLDQALKEIATAVS